MKRHVDQNLFDEAHHMVLKELLPFWHSFVKSSLKGNKGGDFPDRKSCSGIFNDIFLIMFI